MGAREKSVLSHPAAAIVGWLGVVAAPLLLLLNARTEPGQAAATPLQWRPGLAPALFAVAALGLSSLAAHVVTGARRSPRAWWSRALGCLGLGMAIADVALGADLIGHQPSWTAAAAGWVALTFATLVLAAYQWPTRYFRGFALLALFGGVILVAAVGRNVALAERATDARVEATVLDGRLADLTVRIRAARTAATATLATQTAAAEQAGDDEARAAAQGSYDAAVQRADRQDRRARQAQAAIGAACDAAGAANLVEPADAEACTAAEPGPLADVASTRTRVALAALSVAELEHDLADDDASGAALAQAQRNAAEAQVAQEQRDVEGVSVVDAVAAGAQSLLAGLTDPDRSTPSSVPWQQTALTWTLILILLTVTYRWLEILNAGLTPGPVAFDPGGTQDDDDDALRIKTLLLKNFPEPGPQPGKGATDSITDLVSIDETGAGKVAKAVVGFLNATALPARGYEVTATLRQPSKRPDPSPAQQGRAIEDDANRDPDEAGPWWRRCLCPARTTELPAAEPATETVAPPPAETSVVLVIVSRRTRATLQVISEGGESQPTGSAAGLPPVERAALRAASWIVAQCRGVPPWLQYEPDATVTQPDPSARAAPDEAAASSTDVWDLSRGRWPAESLVRLGDAADLREDHTSAALYYGLALTRWPDYTVARYRLASSLTAIQGKATESDQSRQGDVTRDQPGPGDPLAADVVTGVLSPGFPSRHTDAVGHTTAVAHSTRVLTDAILIPIRRLSVRERGAAAPLRAWRRVIRLTRIARDVTRVTTEGATGITGPRTPDRHASVAYNQACLWSALAAAAVDPVTKQQHAATSARFLAHALTSPGAESLSLAWLPVDPDLRGLRDDHASWDRLRRQFGL